MGDPVSVQNQTGNCPRRWDKTGRIAEVLNHGQYVVKMDGSGRCTLRNRGKFLRRCQPFCTDPPMLAIPSAGNPVPTPTPDTADDLGVDTDTNRDPIPQDVYDEHAVNIPAVQSPRVSLNSPRQPGSTASPQPAATAQPCRSGPFDGV